MACAACFLIQTSPTCSDMTLFFFYISINNQESAVPTGSQASLMEAVLVDSRFQSFLSPSVGLVFGVYSFTGLILRLGTPVSL